MDHRADSSPVQGAYLVLGAALRAKLVAWARNAIPSEACGLLVGETRGVREGARVIRSVTLSENLAGVRARSEFVLDPAHWVRVEKEAAERGLRVLGVWHSHPSGHPLGGPSGGRASAGAAAPSVRDAAGAMPEWSNLIVSVGFDSGAYLRSWRAPKDPSGDAEMLEEALR